MPFGGDPTIFDPGNDLIAPPSLDTVNASIFLPQSAGDPSMYDPGSTLIPPTGGAASNSPVQSSGTGSKILGWLGLATNVTNTVVNATRTGYTTRPGVNSKATSLGSFGTLTGTTLVVILAVFVGVLFLLRK